MLADDSTLWETPVFSPSGTSHVVTHPDAGGTTEGSTVILFANLTVEPATVTLPAGWEQDSNVFKTAFRYSGTGAGETSWTFTTSAACEMVGYLWEVDGLALVDPLDLLLEGGAGSTANAATRSLGPTALNAGSQVWAVAIFVSDKANVADTHSWSTWTDSFVEAADVSDGSHLGHIGIARKIIDGTGTFSATATFATSAGTATTQATLLLYRAADATINAPLFAFTGYEWGTHGGLEGTAAIDNPTGVASTGTGSPTAVWDTDYAIEAGAAKDTGYGLRLTAAANAPRLAALINVGNKCATGFDIKPVSGTGTPIVAFLTATGQDIYLRYDFTTNQFGLEWQGGSTVWQTGTSPLGTHAHIDIGVKTNSATHHLAWWIETGTDDGTQTSPTDLTGQAVGTALALFWGTPSGVNATFVMHYDNPMISKQYAAHPLTPHRIIPVVPETTGATVSGTSTNFSRFTANGTLAALSVDTVGALLDEIPPTISASADGICQTATAASDYVELPMDDPTLADDEIIAAVRFVAAQWGGTGAGTGTLGWRGYDGLTEKVLISNITSYDAGSPTAIAATAPLWRSAMWSGAASGAWTRTRLNAAALRMGFSSDAAPDMGATLIMLEVAIKQARLEVLFGEPPGIYIEAVRNPDTLGLEGFTVNIPAGESVTVDYEVDGVPYSTGLLTDADSPYYEAIPDGGSSFQTVNKITLIPG